MSGLKARRLTPIFICGHYRSGTSLLNHLFDGHPEILALPIETKFFTSFLPELRKKGDVQVALQLSIMRHFYPRQSPDISRFYGSISPVSFLETFDDFVEGISESDESGYLDAYVEACLSFSTDRSKVRYWVEKTPMNEVFTDEILNYWPNARFIHVYRDPRDVHHTVRSRSDFALQPRTTAHNWLRSISILKSNLELIGADKYFELSYEDLVSNPETIMHNISEFLSIDYNESLLNPTTGLNTVEWSGNARTGKYNMITTQSLGKWRNSQFLDEMKIIEYLCEARLVELGYSPELKLSLSDRFNGVTQRFILLLKRLRKTFSFQKKATY